MKSEQQIIHTIIKYAIKKNNLLKSEHYRTSKEIQECVKEYDTMINTLINMFESEKE